MQRVMLERIVRLVAMLFYGVSTDDSKGSAGIVVSFKRFAIA